LLAERVEKSSSSAAVVEPSRNPRSRNVSTILNDCTTEGEVVVPPAESDAGAGNAARGEARG
jgi:hypothetical protein